MRSNPSNLRTTFYYIRATEFSFICFLVFVILPNFILNNESHLMNNGIFWENLHVVLAFENSCCLLCLRRRKFIIACTGGEVWYHHQAEWFIPPSLMEQDILGENTNRELDGNTTFSLLLIMWTNFTMLSYIHSYYRTKCHLNIKCLWCRCQCKGSIDVQFSCGWYPPW